MKTIKLLGFSAALAVLLAAGDASAAGLVMNATDLPAKARTDLAQEIARAKTDVPELVKEVREVAAHARELDASSRLPGAPLTMPLKALGPRAFGPMIELLAFDAPVARDLPGTAATALRLGLIEAVGIIRDARAIPVFALLLDRATDFDTQRASAEGLARIGTDDAVAVLSSAAQKARGTERERAILSGMHDCRREAAAKLLASRLDAADVDDATARIVVKSLGGVGNAWAWKTLPSQAEQTATRAAAARALVRAYVRFGSSEVREAAAKALLVVDDPSTTALVAEAKRTANADALAALGALEKRLAKNPTH